MEGPYRVFFYSFDCHEPKHVHIQREKFTCKFWLEPTALNGRFSLRELTIIRRLVGENIVRIMEAWHEHCGEDR
ncbi:MAG: hypothetical protein CV089_10180 [Nitrospira sp. WS110]|nr:hypothetical protein [Nitrospira sp. WS110]